MGSLPVLTQHVIHNTKHIKVGPIGYVLPGWNPLRLALEIAWLDQLTKGRTFVGFARGYQTRWLNQMAQKIHVGATASDKSEGDRVNREAFEEVFRFLKLAWGDEPFRFKGKYYEYPSPQEGTPWPAHEWTREYGFPGEVDDQGRIQMMNIVPKPFQTPASDACSRPSRSARRPSDGARAKASSRRSCCRRRRWCASLSRPTRRKRARRGAT